ncbi:hypothetical protein ACZ90_45035 [Streptomyces albus subsp. albus]|nr:hypothetical protein ACZ90_45035 [Streptomyces albus subsp. albus]
MRLSRPARRGRVVILGAIAMLLAATGVSATAGSASAASVGFRLRNYQSWDCLDASGASSDPGTAAIQWDCHDDVNQAWYEWGDANGRGQLRNWQSGMCLDIPGGSRSPGASLVLWPCNNGWNQVWEMREARGWSCPSGRAVYYINPETGFALDNPGGSQAGTQMAAYPYWGGKNQIWCRGA